MRALKLYFAGFFLIELLLHAGWPIWPLLGLSVLSLALILERIWYLRTSHIAPVDLLAPLLTQCRTALPTQQQSQDLKENSVLGQLLSTTIERVRQQPMISEAGLRQALEIVVIDPVVLDRTLVAQRAGSRLDENRDHERDAFLRGEIVQRIQHAPRAGSRREVLPVAPH